MSATPIRAAVYCYGPLTEADTRLRFDSLGKVARQRGWRVVKGYHDNACARPFLQEMLAAVRAGELQALLVDDINELGAGVLEVAATVGWPATCGLQLVALKPPLDTGSADRRQQVGLLRQLAGNFGDRRDGGGS
jgi:DNA invertase Pin-like site-specific DNA recombinase